MIWNPTSFLRYRSVQFCILLLISCAVFLPHLGDLPADLMEARNFVTAREMVENNNWLIPTLNGVPRIAKPPLPTWITAGVYFLAGQQGNDGILRLPAALMGMGLVFALWGLVRCLSENDQLAFVCATVSATSFLITEMSRNGSWDIYCHSFMLFAAWCLAAGWKRKENAYLPFLGAGIFMACSFMSKGPVAFYALLLPFGLAYGIAFGTQEITRKRSLLLLAVIIVVCLSSLWPMLIYFKMPHIFSATSSTEAAAWVARHRRPFFFYGHFPLYSGLWAFYVIAAIFFSFARERIRQVGNYRFIILWGAISLILLSVVPEKKERYLLPTMIPAAILAGHLIYAQLVAASHRKLNGNDLKLVYFQSGLIALIAWAAPAVLFLIGVKNDLLSTLDAVAWSTLFIVLAGASLHTALKKNVKGLFTTAVFLPVLISLSLWPSLDLMLRHSYPPSSKTLLKVRQMDSIQNLPFFTVEELNPKRIWDVGKMVQKWDIVDNPRLANRAPFVLLTTRAPSDSLPANLQKLLTITALGKFRYDPKDALKFIYLSLIRHQSIDLSSNKAAL